MDCDGTYDDGSDVPIPDPEIRDGSYDAGDDCLVVPPSVGAISADSISLAGEGVAVEVDLSATTYQGGVRVDARTEPIRLTGVTASVGDDGVVAVAGEGPVDVSGSTLASSGTARSVRLRSAADAVSLDGADVDAGDAITLDGRSVSATDATLTASTSGGSVTVSADVVVFRRATVESAGGIDVDATLTLSADRATMTATGDLDLRSTDVSVAAGQLTTTGSGSAISASADGTVDWTDASGEANGTVTVEAGELTVADARVETTAHGRALRLSATDGLTATDATVRSTGAVRLEAGTALDVSEATVDGVGGSDATTRLLGDEVDAARTTVETNGPVRVTAGTDLLAPGATFDTSSASGMDVRLTASGGDVVLESAVVRTDGGDSSATVPGQDGAWIYVEDGVFDDANAALDVTPDDRYRGTPAPGYGVE